MTSPYLESSIPASYLSPALASQTQGARLGTPVNTQNSSMLQKQLAQMSPQQQIAYLQSLLQQAPAGTSTPLTATSAAVNPLGALGAAGATSASTNFGALGAASPLGALGATSPLGASAGLLGTSPLGANPIGPLGTPVAATANPLGALGAAGPTQAQLAALGVAGVKPNPLVATANPLGALGAAGATTNFSALGVAGATNATTNFGALGVAGATNATTNFGALGVAGATNATTNFGALGAGATNATTNFGILGAAGATSPLGVTPSPHETASVLTAAQLAQFSALGVSTAQINSLTPAQLTMLMTQLNIGAPQPQPLQQTPQQAMQPQLLQHPVSVDEDLSSMELPLESMDDSLLNPQLLSLKKRKQVLTDFIEGEKNYIHDLKEFAEYYAQSLNIVLSLHKQNADVGFVLMQSEVIELIAKINEESFAHLFKLAKSQITVGVLCKAFVTFVKKINPYVGFCSNFEECIKKMKTLRISINTFDTLLADCKKRSGSNLEVDDYLSKPIARLKMYPKILKDFEDTVVDPTQKQVVNSTHEAVQLSVNEIEISRRKSVNRHNLLFVINNVEGLNQSFITKDRVFLTSFNIQKFNKRGKCQKRKFFLFSDIIIYCQPGQKLPLKLCKGIAYKDAEIAEDITVGSKMPTDFYYKFISFADSGKGKNLYLAFSSASEKQKFGNLFAQAKTKVLSVSNTYTSMLSGERDINDNSPTRSTRKLEQPLGNPLIDSQNGHLGSSGKPQGTPTNTHFISQSSSSNPQFGSQRSATDSSSKTMTQDINPLALASNPATNPLLAAYGGAQINEQNTNTQPKTDTQPNFDSHQLKNMTMVGNNSSAIGPNTSPIGLNSSYGQEEQFSNNKNPSGGLHRTESDNYALNLQAQTQTFTHSNVRDRNYSSSVPNFPDQPRARVQTYTDSPNSSQGPILRALPASVVSQVARLRSSTSSTSSDPGSIGSNASFGTSYGSNSSLSTSQNQNPSQCLSPIQSSSPGGPIMRPLPAGLAIPNARKSTNPQLRALPNGINLADLKKRTASGPVDVQLSSLR